MFSRQSRTSLLLPVVDVVIAAMDDDMRRRTYGWREMWPPTDLNRAGEDCGGRGYKEGHGRSRDSGQFHESVMGDTECLSREEVCKNLLEEKQSSTGGFGVKYRRERGRGRLWHSLIPSSFNCNRCLESGIVGGL